MAKRWNKALAFALALCMCVSSMNVSVWATTTDTVDVPAKEDGSPIEVEIQINDSENKKEISGSAEEDGYKAEIKGEFETNNDEIVNGKATYTSENSDGTYKAEGGYEVKT